MSKWSHETNRPEDYEPERVERHRHSTKVWVALSALAALGGVCLVFWQLGVGAEFDTSCSVRGTGAVACKFANKGWFPGDHCVNAGVRPKTGGQSTTERICSGLLWPGGDKIVQGLGIESPIKVCGLGWLESCDVVVTAAR